LKITTDIIDKLIRRDEEYRVRHRIQHFLTLHQTLMDIAEYESLLKKVFRADLEKSQINTFEKLQSGSIKMR
jgi:uncharacterized damage-inducible protein DinB